MDYYGNNDWRDYIAHYGTPRHSGRYPWGSGKNPRAGTAKYYGGVAGGPKQIGDIKSSTSSRGEITDGDALPDAGDKKARKEWLTSAGKSDKKADTLTKMISDNIVDLHTATAKSKKYEEIRNVMQNKRRKLMEDAKKLNEEANKEIDKMVFSVLKSMKVKDLASVPKERHNEFREKLISEVDNNLRYRQVIRRLQATNNLIEKTYDKYLRKAAKAALRELGFPVDEETIAVMEDFLFL